MEWECGMRARTGGCGSDHAIEEAWQAVKSAAEVGVGDVSGLFGTLGKKDVPAVGLEPVLVGHGFGVTTLSDLGVSGEEVGDLHSGDEVAMDRGLERGVVMAGGADETGGELMLLEVSSAQFGVIHAQDLPLGLQQGIVAGSVGINGFEMGWKGGRHGNLAHVVQQAGHVIHFRRRTLRRGNQFTGENGRADAVLPERTPGILRARGQLLEVLDDGCDHDELADLAHTQVEHGFLDALGRGFQRVVDGIDEAEQTRGEAGVASNDIGDLMGVSGVRMHEFPERAINASKRGQSGAGLETGLDFSKGQRLEFAGNRRGLDRHGASIGISATRFTRKARKTPAT